MVDAIKTSKIGPLGCGLILAVAISAMPAWAVDQAGEVITLTGQATAATTAGEIKPLNQGAPVSSGDTVVTNPNSWVRMKFTDGAFVILRPNTRFVIEDYKDTGNAATDRSIFNLVKGGFRAVTGLVGKRNPKNYAVRTAVATIGIRGTDHEGRICDDDCNDVDPPPPNGLYTGTHEGETDVNGNPNGPGEYTYTDPDGNTEDITKGQADPLTDDPIPPADPDDC
jgi:hypothetical protein